MWILYGHKLTVRNALLILNINIPVVKNCAVWWYMDVTICTINCYFESKPPACVLRMTSIWLTSLYTFTVMPETSYKMKRLQYGTCSDVLNSCFLQFPNIYYILCWGGGGLLLLLSLLLVDAKAAGEAFS